MNDIKRAIETLKDLSRGKKGLKIEEHVPTLTSTIGLLEHTSPSIDHFKSLSELLRQRLQPFYLAHLQPTLDYAIAVLRFLHMEKIVPSLRSGDPGRANLWGSPASSLVSGILDFLEQHQTKKARETVGSAVYPTICAFYFTNGQGLLSLYDGNILSNVYMLLGETVESPGGDITKLRDYHIGGRRLGRTIAEIRNYLALESIINLLGNLIPPLKAGKEKRNKFLQDVFEESTFKDCKRILQALEVIKRDWTVTATKIIYLLAESDIRFPQPFQVIRFQVESSLMTTSEPIFVDNKSFVAGIDQGGSVESLMIPFTTVTAITISALNGSEMKVELLINKAPLLGNKPMSLPQRESYSLSFSFMRASMNNFGKVMRERNLKMERPASRKLSQAPSELLPEINGDVKWQVKATMLTNMAKHGGPDPIDRNNFATSSPGPAISMASNVDDHLDASGVVGESPDNLPSTVFLDPNGNFSIHPPRAMDMDHAQTETAPKKVLLRNQQPDSEDEEISYQPKRSTKAKTHTIILSDDEDECPPSPEVRALKKSSRTTKKSDTAQVKKTDDITSRKTQNPETEIVDDDSRKSKSNTSNDIKKRALVDDTSDVEIPAIKRVRQESDSVPPSSVKQGPKKYGRKSQHVKVASPAKNNDSWFDVDYDEIPKPKQDRPQPRVKAMKGKDGKVAPKPRPVTTKKNKKQGEAKEASQCKANLELQDADKTLVEQHEIGANVGRSAKVVNPLAVSKNKAVNTRSKKSNMAPWEMQDFASVKVEMTEEVAVNFDPIDDLPSKTEELPSDIANDTENHDLPLTHVGILGDRYVDFLEPLRAETTTSSEPPRSPPAPAQSGQIWIDLTNSPEPATSSKHAVGITSSFDKRRHESVEEDEIPSFHQDQMFHTTRTARAHKTVEKLPLSPTPSEGPESVSSTPRHAKHSRGTKVRKLSSPIRLRRLPISSEKSKPTHKTRHLEEEKIRSRAIPKEQKGGSSGSGRRQVRGPEVEDDPDLRIASVLGEINKILVGNIQSRFTGMSSELQRARKELKAQAAEELGKINHETYKRYNNLVDLYEEYACRKANLVDALEVFEKATADSAQSYRDILNDFRRNSLRNKLPKEIVKESTIADILKLTKLKIEI